MVETGFLPETRLRCTPKRATMVGAWSLRPLYPANGVFRSHDLGKTLAMGGKLLGGVVTGRFSAGNLRRLLEVSGRAARIRTLYERFPQDLAEFEAWVAEAKPLWGNR